MAKLEYREEKTTRKLKWESPELVKFGNSGLGQAPAPICEVQGSTPNHDRVP